MLTGPWTVTELDPEEIVVPFSLLKLGTGEYSNACEFAVMAARQVTEYSLPRMALGSVLVAIATRVLSGTECIL